MWHVGRKRVGRQLHWRWVLLGLVVMVGGHVVAVALFGGLLSRLAQESALFAFALSGALSLVIYFLGGLVVGRLSPGRTIQEPAVAGVLGLVLLFFLQLSLGMINLFGLLIGAPFCYAMAYFGGWAGERWQRAAWRRRAADNRESAPPR